MLPGLTAAEAYALGERLRLAVEDMGLPHPGGGFVTVSVGAAACVPDRARTYFTLVDAADSALYASKKAGRNCVTANCTVLDRPDPAERGIAAVA